MSAQQSPKPPGTTDETKQPDASYTPASPVKRTLAWIGIIYMLILLGLTCYFYFTGTMLGNLGPLLTVPALIGGGAIALISWHTTGRPGKWAAISAAVIFWLLAAATIPIGFVGLLSNFS